MKPNITKQSKNREKINQELETLKNELAKIKETNAEKEKSIHELKMKKRSIKALFKRNEMMYCTLLL